MNVCARGVSPIFTGHGNAAVRADAVRQHMRVVLKGLNHALMRLGTSMRKASLAAGQNTSWASSACFLPRPSACSCPRLRWKCVAGGPRVAYGTGTRAVCQCAAPRRGCHVGAVAARQRAIRQSLHRCGAREWTVSEVSAPVSATSSLDGLNGHHPGTWARFAIATADVPREIGARCRTPWAAGGYGDRSWTSRRSFL